MADAVVSFVAQKAASLVVENAASALTKEVSLFRGAQEDVQYITQELEAMRSFLRDADFKEAIGEQVDSSFKAWVKQVRELAFCIEDLVDRWALYAVRGRHEGGLLRKLCCSIKKLKDRRDIVSEIQEIKKLLVEAKERFNTFWIRGGQSGSSAGNNNTWHDPRMASLFVNDADLVGIEGPKKDLVSKLVDETGVSKNKVISIVGMGGLGKTTLAKKVFDDPRVEAHFDCHAWITVSQSYKTYELLMDMIKQFCCTMKEVSATTLERVNTMGEASLMGKLKEYLAEKRYVVVFDDVWKIDFWDYIRLALPDNGKGSRIMFTARNENVVPFSKESPFYHVYKLAPLSHDKAFELFHKKAFLYSSGPYSSSLIELSQKIVQRCGGLPLAIVTIGGLLATKNKDVSEWQQLYDGLSFILTSKQELADDQRLASIERVLLLNYHDLPFHLKICFLYLGMFPEDYVINCSRIMRLWMAQGFIKRRKGVALVNVAEKYLTELLHRSLVQVERVSADGRARACRIHDLLREIIILPKLEELGLHHVLGDRDVDIDGRCRHLAIQGWANNVAECLNNSQARSMILLGKGEQLGSKFFKFLYHSKLLTALDLEKTPLDYIPEELGNLWYLRYLSLKETKVKVLPNSIGRLCNLETLDLRESLVYDLPVEISRLLKLQYLLAFSVDYDSEFSINTWRGVKIHNGIRCLEALQKLFDIEVEQGPELIGELGRLTQLQKLGIKKLRETDCSALCRVLEKMTRLRSLYIFLANVEDPLKLESMIVPPPLLGTLALGGRLGMLPRWISELKNLVKLKLFWSRLGDEEDLLQVLQALPNLEDLRLVQGYEGQRLHFSKRCFAKMKVLYLRGLDALRMLVIEKGALPLLRELHLGPFPELEELPNFHFLGNLNTLRLYDLQKHFVFELLPEGGHHYWKIRHVPDVVFRIQFRGIVYSDAYKIGDPRLEKLLDERAQEALD